MNPEEYKSPPELLEHAKACLVADDFNELNSVDIKICSLLQNMKSEYSFDALSTEQQLCMATFTAEGQVGGGGLFDFFQYTSDKEILSAMEGFEAFGATDLLKLIEKAIKKFPKSPPLPSHESREEILDAWFDKDKDPFGKLDDKFHDIGSALKGRIQYIIAHQEQFFNS